MRLLSWLWAKPEKRTITRHVGTLAGLVDPPARSGVAVNEQAALSLSTVWRASRVISESVGTLPLKVYRRTDTGREEARTHPLWTLLHDSPNDEQTPFDFFSLMQFWAVLWGNAYAEVERDGAGNALALWPIPPAAVRVGRNASGRLVYEVATDNGQAVELPAEDLIHVRGPSLDGSEGARLVQLARESFGLSIAAERFGASFYGNAARPSGVLQTAGQLSDTARANLRQSWSAMYSGADNVGKVPVLEEGLTFSPFSITNNEAQFLETRQFQVAEICRWIGVDPLFVFAFGSNPGGVAEAQQRQFLQFTLNPWLTQWEQHLSRKLLTVTDRVSYYPEFTRAALIQMDATTQHNVWKTGIDAGWYTVDEVRGWLNLPPLPEEPEPLPALVQPQQPTDTPKESNGNTQLPQQV